MKAADHLAALTNMRSVSRRRLESDPFLLYIQKLDNLKLCVVAELDLDVIAKPQTPLVCLAVSSRRFLSKSRYNVAGSFLAALPSNFQFIVIVNSGTTLLVTVVGIKEAVLIEPTDSTGTLIKRKTLPCRLHKGSISFTCQSLQKSDCKLAQIVVVAPLQQYQHGDTQHAESFSNHLIITNIELKPPKDAFPERIESHAD